MSDRRAKGLCYYFDEKYTPEHYLKHKNPQLYALEVDEQEEEIYEDAIQEEEQNEVIPQISVNVVAGLSDYRTMKFKGVHKKIVVFILIDSGSTHNFIDVKVVKKLGCVPNLAELTKVAVADGRKLKVNGTIKNLQWNFQHNTFKVDFMVIPLGNCDMVLGVQWLETLSPITWNFKTLEMSFTMGKHKVVLKGIQQGSLREVKTVKWLKRKEEQAQLSMILFKKWKQKRKLICIYWNWNRKKKK